jgi:hypothetical protein
MMDEVFSRSPDQRPPPQSEAALMRQSLRLCADATDYIDDLKPILLKNETTRAFFTCDNPALLTNRFHLQRLDDRSVAMPLSPEYYFLYQQGRSVSLRRKENSVRTDQIRHGGKPRQAHAVGHRGAG